MKLNRYRLETFCTFIAVATLAVITVIAILGIGDMMFEWNIFPPEFERILGFLIGTLAVILASSVLVSIMINLSIVAIRITSIDLKIKNEAGREKQEEGKTKE